MHTVHFTVFLYSKYTQYVSLCSYTPSTCSMFHCVPILQVHTVRFTVFLYSKYMQYVSLCSYTPSTHSTLHCVPILQVHTCVHLLLCYQRRRAACARAYQSPSFSPCVPQSLVHPLQITQDTNSTHTVRDTYVSTYVQWYKFVSNKGHEFRSCFNEKCTNSTNSGE